MSDVTSRSPGVRTTEHIWQVPLDHAQPAGDGVLGVLQAAQQLGIRARRVVLTNYATPVIHFRRTAVADAAPVVRPAELAGFNEITAADIGSHLRCLATGTVVSYDSCLKMIAMLKQQQHRDRRTGFAEIEFVRAEHAEEESEQVIVHGRAESTW